MNIDEMNIFAAIVHHRSFSKAARERNLTPSSLSHTISHLEDKLGVRLLNRTTRSVSPTEAGERLLSRLRPALEDIKLALDEMNQYRDSPQGVLRINMPKIAEELLFNDILAVFKQSFKQIRIEIVTDDRLIDIVDEGFDAGVRFGNQLSQDMIGIPIGPRLKLIPVASAEFIQACGRPMHPYDLNKFNCINRRYPGGMIYKWEFYEGNKLISVAVEGDLVLDNDNVMIRAACRGLGIAFTCESYVETELRSGQLVALLADYTPMVEGFYLYYPSGKHLPAALGCFIDWLKHQGATH